MSEPPAGATRAPTAPPDPRSSVPTGQLTGVRADLATVQDGIGR